MTYRDTDRKPVDKAGRVRKARAAKLLTATILAAASIGMVRGAPEAAANPRFTILNRDYRVHGASERALVDHLKRRPFRGDNGPALANIRPRYSLTVATERTGRACRIKRLDLSIRFVLTLPRAVDAARFSPRTRRVWSHFRAFAERHEAVHRRIYLGCARRYLRKVRALSGTLSCSALRATAKRRLRAQKRDCERLNDAFDRRELPRIRHLALFRNARLKPRAAPGRPARSPGFGLRHAFGESDR